MLKLNTSFSKKVPIPGQDFSSQSFHASVEVELSDALHPAEIKSRIHDTFTMVKSAVEDELNDKVKAVIVNSNVPENRVDLPNAGTGKATNKQLKYLTDLARELNITLNEMNEQVRELYGVDSVYGLCKADASKLVESLKQRKAA